MVLPIVYATMGVSCYPFYQYIYIDGKSAEQTAKPEKIGDRRRRVDCGRKWNRK